MTTGPVVKISTLSEKIGVLMDDNFIRLLLVSDLGCYLKKEVY